MSTFVKVTKTAVDAMNEKILQRLEQLSGLSSIARGDPPPVTVADWLAQGNISASDCIAYPNARIAYEILNSPLGKALS